MQHKFKAGQEQASKQLEAMQRQQEALERIKSPEDFSKFMADQGITPEDIQRAMSGDEAHMRGCFERALGGGGSDSGGGVSGLAARTDEDSDKLNKMLSTVDEIHRE